ncbi:MAG: Gfo/Idh/MocA family protein [Nostocoides sp.]
MSQPRVILSGASHWHAPLYVDALARSDARVVGVVDDDSQIRSRTAAALASTPFSHVGDALAAEPADLVVVLDRHDRMPQAATEAVAEGVPILLEKPGASSLADLRSLRDQAAAAGVAITVPFVHRRAPFAHYLLHASHPASLSVTYIAGPPSRYPANGSPWMLDPVAAGGGVLVNLGVHFVDLARVLFGRSVSRVHATVSHVHGLGVEDFGSLVLEFGPSQVATIEVGYLYPTAPSTRHVSIRLAAADRFVSVAHDGAVRTTYADDRTTEAWVDLDSDSLFLPFVQAALAGCGSGFPGLPTMDDLVEAMEVIHEAYPANPTTTEARSTWAT